MNLQLQDISDLEFNTMYEAVERILTEYGVLFESEEAHKLLLKAGNKEMGNGRISLDKKFIRKTLEAVPKEGFTLYGRDEAKKLAVQVDSMSFRPSTGMPFIFDYEKRERREATLEDAKDMVIITDALEHYDMVNSIVSPADAPGEKGNIKRFINAHTYSTKPSDITAATAKEVEAIGKITAIIRGGEKEVIEKPLTIIDISMITPMRCTKEESEAFIECAKLGIPVEILTSPSMGISSPITVAGSVAVSMAEMIAAIGLLYTIRPGLGVVNTARISPVNMRTTAYNYGAPELSIGSVVTAACSARFHIPCNLYGFGTVGKTPDIQVGFEKMFGGALMAMGRSHMITGSGTLDNALVTSKELLVIDHEMARFLKRARQPIEITEKSIGIDSFLKGMAEMRSMITEEHTIEYLNRNELLDASLNQWGSLDQWEKDGKPGLLERAHEKVVSILKAHSPEPIEASVRKKIEEVVEGF